MDPQLQRCFNDWIVIGISGVTCSGKTSAALSLTRALAGAILVHQDRYFLPDADPRHIPSAVAGHHDYDVLNALDMEAMYRDLCRIITGQDNPSAIAVPNSDALCVEALHPCQVRGKRVLIVEGFTILNYPPIYRLCHLRYYLDLELAECERRRDSRVYDPPDLPDYLRLVAWPRHLQHKAQLLAHSSHSDAPTSVRIVPVEHTSALRVILEDLRPLGLELVEDTAPAQHADTTARHRGDT